MKYKDLKLLFFNYKKNVVFRLSLILICSFIGSNHLTAQKKLESNFTLDTTQTQILPYDLDFSLNLVDSEMARVKWVYLVRLNNKRKVVFDNQTSFYRLGQSPNSKNLIISKLNKDILKSKEHLKAYADSLRLWKKSKEDNEKRISSEEEKDKIEQLKCENRVYELRIRQYLKHQKFLDSLNNDPKGYISEAKKQFELSPLEIEGRNKDTLTVVVPPLRPNKNYLILAVNESKKTKILKTLVEKYLECGAVEKKEVVVIPLKYLPKNSNRRVKLDLNGIKKENDAFKQKKEEIKFVIPAKSFEKAFANAKEKKIDSLLAINKNKLELIGLDSFKTFPGPFKYPISSLKNNTRPDSIFTYVPNEFNKEFKIVNAVLSQFKNHGDSIIRGKYKLIEDDKDVLKIDFKPKSDLTNQLTTIAEHLNIANKAQQALFLLAEAESDNYRNFDSYFSNLINVLSQNRDTLAKRVDAETKVNSLINSMNIPYGLQTQSLEKGTFSYQFLTRSSGIIKQSAGFVYYTSAKGDFSGFAPYTGVDFQIRSTNENSKFWKIRGWEKFLSFQLGVPVFASELTKGERREHLVGDTFSLYTGIGFNLGHAVKVGYGAVLFKSIDGSSIGERTYKINSAHAITIGINFKLIPLLKNIFGSDQAVNLVK